MTTASSTSPQRSRAQQAGLAPDRLLESWALYRIGIAGALIWLLSSPWRPPDFSEMQLRWLIPFLLIYLLTGTLFLAANRSGRFSLLSVVVGHVVCDLAAAAVAIYAAGGVQSGLGTLFIVPAALGSLFLPRSAVSVPPAVATLILLGAEFRLGLEDPEFSAYWPQAGLLGALLFLIAWLGGYIAQRTLLGEAVARSAATNLGQLRKLAAEVVERMQSAVIVCDVNGHILLRNASSQQFFAPAQDRRPLAEREPDLWVALEHFRAAPENAKFEPVQLRNGREVWPQFIILPGDPDLLLIVFDDPERIQNQLQQTRLAAIGQVTAGVAHDIRNPLAALSNAAQLLLEEPESHTDDLLAVIQRQSRRLNRVVERVYQLAQPLQTRPESVSLADFIGEMVGDHATLPGAPMMRLDIPPETPHVRMDPDHLAECIDNLMENATKHAHPENGDELTVSFSVDLSDPEYVGLRLRDNGKRPSNLTSTELFEAFRGRGGLGIGLYLCRELLQANGGTIHLHLEDAPGTCFELLLPRSD